MTLLWFLLIGLAAGWLASTLMKGKGLGLLGNLLVGVIGAFLGGWLLAQLGVSIGTGNVLLSQLITAFIGAVVLLLLVRLITR